MLNIPVKNPLTIQIITVGAGIAAILVAHFAPAYSVMLADILRVLGIGAMGVGAASITAAKPAEPQPVVVAAAANFNGPDHSGDAQMTSLQRRRRAWRLGPAWAFMLSLLLAACAPMTPAKWAKLGACADMLEQPLLNEVAAVLAGDGDVGQGLLAIATGGEGQDAVECAVAQLANDIGKQPADARHARIRARGQAFLATVPQ